MNKLLLAFCLACPLGTWAGPIEAGQPLPAPTLQNQHGQAWRIASDTRLVIFAAGRSASNLVMAVLSPQPRDFLASRQAVYLADMSKMPGFITRTFALPSLREQPFEVGVSLDASTLAGWPRQEDAVTLIRLDHGRVIGHDHASTEGQLKAALGL